MNEGESFKYQVHLLSCRANYLHGSRRGGDRICPNAPDEGDGGKANPILLRFATIQASEASRRANLLYATVVGFLLRPK